MNSSGTAFIGWGTLLLAIAFLLYFLQRLIGNNQVLLVAMWISAAAGGIVISTLLVLVFIELRQDKAIDHVYQKNHKTKLRISETYFECQNCGNKKVMEHQTSCPLCGITFTENKKV